MPQAACCIAYYLHAKVEASPASSDGGGAGGGVGDTGTGGTHAGVEGLPGQQKGRSQ